MRSDNSAIGLRHIYKFVRTTLQIYLTNPESFIHQTNMLENVRAPVYSSGQPMAPSYYHGPTWFGSIDIICLGINTPTLQAYILKELLLPS